jgi:hypothetical protein
MRCSLFKFTLCLNSALLFWKLLVLELLLDKSENFMCSLPAFLVKIVLLLDALQLLMLFVGTLICLEPKLLLLMIS